ncbi:hypothetical protein LOZ39_005583 [Ophidiomyces ophidiicola]|nr:hypothetical protein LOZ49_004189 [Ophidiomyces ophidiicola]KAI2068877.1 hypothetical protein LOZ39_005583 [Ophidiomyces ophidiicola]KAI2139117.1 hypothetical protein LOZ29_002548 [Ophidiomyces ophidiicola]KAI2140054.1 hypothetical protein LOZ28_002993 [Ophidiomyces ophidiicola]KAI2220168.1 hypothetical protein LOZ15_002382 [Ophidiomyces ophidiicola]
MSSAAAASQPRAFPTSGFDLIEESRRIEEETLPGYTPDKYYPVRLGEVLGNRYHVVGKLGYGTTSTVWLGRDLQEESRYVTLKLYVSGLQRDTELRVYDRFDMIETDHPGKTFLRKLFGSFYVKGKNNARDGAGDDTSHLCLVHEPLGLSLDQVLDLYPHGKFPLEVLKPSLRQILMAVSFLHEQAMIAHTDLQTTNMLIGVVNPIVFTLFERAEHEQPTPRKVLEDRVIYTTRRLLPSEGLPFLCDFGEARFTDEDGFGAAGEDIMPDVYKAPEVMLQMKWDEKVDIWNMVMVVWQLVTGKTLFKGKNKMDDLVFQDDRVHLAEICALIGQPPVEFLKRSEMCPEVWNADGSWKGVVPIPDISLEGLAKTAEIEGEDLADFLKFLRRMLRWLPEERPTCRELVYDPWLMKGLGEKQA